jgi:hypothetical protein
MKEIEVVRSSELNEGYSTPGIVRAKAFESIHRFVIVSRRQLLVARCRIGITTEKGISTGFLNPGACA